MMFKNKLLLFCFIIVSVILAGSDVSEAQGIECSVCHGELMKKTNIHAAMQMGCTACHTGIDPKKIPHDVTNNVSKGLSAQPPDLCFNCHDRALFEGKKVRHAPVAGGMCTACHSPHSSDNEKLLTAELPALCYTCHDTSLFSGAVMHQPAQIGLCVSCHAPHQSDMQKLLVSDMPDLCFLCHEKDMFSKSNIHVPVAGGMCTACHNPHAAEGEALLGKRPIAVCLDCHQDVAEKPHLLSVGAGKGHPVGSLQKTKKPKEDPVRKGKEFSCSSCHDPHSSEWTKLLRYSARNSFELCINCHQK